METLLLVAQNWQHTTQNLDWNSWIEHKSIATLLLLDAQPWRR